MSFLGLLNNACTIQTLTETQSATGKIVQACANTTTDVKCRLDTAKGEEIQTNTGKVAKATHTLFIAHATGLLNEKNNRIVCGGITFDILLVADAGGHTHHYELLLQKII
jgi:hypothetical protein